MAKRLGKDRDCRYVADDPKGIGVRCRVECAIEGVGTCSDRSVRVINDAKKYLIVLDGGAVRIASGSELEV